MVYAKRSVLIIATMGLVMHAIVGQQGPESVPMTVEIKASSVAPMKLFLVTQSSEKKGLGLHDVVSYVKKDLEFTKQFLVEPVTIDHKPSKQDFEDWKTRGATLVIFLDYNHESAAFDWRLYDVYGPTMIKGKRYVIRGSMTRAWAHAIADGLWPELTGFRGFFSTKIAYCKDIRDPHARAVKHICVADYDGGHEQLLVETHTLNIAPRWNVDPSYPLLFYSEHTSSNVRLMMAGMDKKRHVVVNFDGLTMLPSFSHDGKRVAFCASRGDGACDIYCFEQGALKRITHNQGNNIAPVFAEQDSIIYFCSDRTGLPQIFAYHCADGHTEQITNGGYCVSPAYCGITKQLAYAKMVQGTMQLFVYDTSTKQHKQLTNDAGDKEECSWSQCGNFLVFAQEKGLKSRIAMLNVQTMDKRFLTSARENCSYPTWSGLYDMFPVVV